MKRILFVSTAIAFLILGIARHDARSLAEPAPIPTEPCLGDACCGDLNADGVISTGEATRCIVDLINRIPEFSCTVCGAITTADCTIVVVNLVNRLCLASP